MAARRLRIRWFKLFKSIPEIFSRLERLEYIEDWSSRNAIIFRTTPL
jgi:hypothetical protein